MISLKKENMKEMSDRQLSSNEIEKVLELQNSTLLRRLPGFGFPDFGLGRGGLGLHATEDSDVTIYSNQGNVEGMLEQQKMIQNLLKHYHKNLVVDNQWINAKNVDGKCSKKRYSTSDLDTEKRREIEKPVKENIPMEEVKNKMKLKKDEDGKVFSKQRKTNFTSKEVETLLDCVRKKKEVILFGVAGGRGWAKAWQDIAKVVTKVDGIPRSEGDVRKKWTYLKWEAKNTSKPGRDPVSKQVLNILTSRDREVQEAMNLRNMDFPEDDVRRTNYRKIHQEISAQMLNDRGYRKSPTQCKVKWKHMKSSFHDAVKTQDRNRCPIYFDQLYKVFEPYLDPPSKASAQALLVRDVTVPKPKNFTKVPPANPGQQQQQQQTPQASPQSQPQPSSPPALNQKKSGLPPLAPKPTGTKLPQSGGSSATIKQLPKLLPKPQTSPEVCLRWNSYHSNMQNTFPSLLNNEQFVDVTLACDGRSIKCHKVMLSACSPYMEELLSSNPCQHPIIFLKDMKFWQLQALVDFMYRGEVNVTQDKLPSLLSAAEALQIKGLASPVNHSAPPKITQVQPMPTNQHDLSEEMDQVTYMRHLQLQTDVKNEYEDEYMQDTDESPPPTPKAKKRKVSSHHTPSQSAGSSNGTNSSGSSNSNANKQIVNKPKRDKERHSEPSTSQQILNTAQALLDQHNAEQRRKSENDKMTDSDNEYKPHQREGEGIKGKNSTEDSSKKKRKAITLQQKIDVIKRHAHGDSNSKISRDLLLHEATVRNIIKHEDEIKEKSKAASSGAGGGSGGVARSGSKKSAVAMVEMERLLALWIEDCNKKGIPLSKATIQARALGLFSEVKKRNNLTDSEVFFDASMGWFDRFKERIELNNVKITGETDSGVVVKESEENYPESFKDGEEEEEEEEEEEVVEGNSNRRMFNNYSEDNRHSTTQDEELDIDEEHAQIILERYSSQNEDYSRGGDGEGDDNSTTSG